MTLHSSCPLHLAHSLRPPRPNLRIRSAAARTFQVYQHQNRPQVDISYIIHPERIFPRRRYKVVAEQYCKISPLICMVCLFFKL